MSARLVLTQIFPLSLYHTITLCPQGVFLYHDTSLYQIRQYDCRTRFLKHTFTGHTAMILVLLCTLQIPHTLFSSSMDNTIKAWDTVAGTLLFSIRTGASPYNMSLSLEGRFLFSTDREGVRKWDLVKRACVRKLSMHPYNYGEQGTLLCLDRLTFYLTIPHKHVIEHWHIEKGLLRRLVGSYDQQQIRMLVCTSDRRKLYSAGYYNNIQEWEASSGRRLRTLRGHKSPVNALILSDTDHSFLFSSSHDTTLKQWDLFRGVCVRTFVLHQPIDALVMANHRLCLRLHDNTVQFWILWDTVLLQQCLSRLSKDLCQWLLSFL